jgi:hypothetical protein
MYPNLNDSIEEEKKYKDAINNTIDELSGQPGGNTINIAVKMVLFDKTHTPIGAGYALGCSDRLITKWTSQFITMVGERVGYARNRALQSQEKGAQ